MEIGGKAVWLACFGVWVDLGVFFWREGVCVHGGRDVIGLHTTTKGSFTSLFPPPNRVQRWTPKEMQCECVNRGMEERAKGG